MLLLEGLIGTFCCQAVEGVLQNNACYNACFHGNNRNGPYGISRTSVVCKGSHASGTTGYAEENKIDC